MTKGINASKIEEGTHIDDIAEQEREQEKKQGRNIFNIQAARIRLPLLKTIREAHQNGILSQGDLNIWEGKIEAEEDNLVELEARRSEIEEELKYAQKLRGEFNHTIKEAEKEGMLKKNEHGYLDQQFLEKSLVEREKALRELEKEVQKRHKVIHGFFKFEKEVQEQRRDSLEGAENYEKKLKILEEASEHNENRNEYIEKLNSYKKTVGKNTRDLFLEWFDEQSLEEQKKAIKKIDDDKDENRKNSMIPRVIAWEIHASLPIGYKTEAFQEWGLRRREQYLTDIGIRVEREYQKSLREGKGLFSEKSYQFYKNEFGKIAFEPSEEKFGKQLKKAISFVEMIQMQVQEENSLWSRFEQLPDEIYDLLEKEFDEADFEERKKLLLEKIPRVAKAYNDLMNRMNNQMDASVSELYRARFEKSKTIEEKTKWVEEAAAHQKLKDEYFKIWEDHAELFESNPEIYERWHNETVRTINQATKAIQGLWSMIRERKGVYEGINKLPDFLQERMNMKASFAERKKQYLKYKKLHEDYYKKVVPFLMQGAEEAQAEEDWDKALNFYLQALKLDPENKTFKQAAAHLRQKGAMPSLKPSSRLDEKETEKILEEVDNITEISEEAVEIAQKEMLADLAQKHASTIGATATTEEARTTAAIGHLEEEDQDIAKAALKEEGIKDKFTVDQEGVFKEKIKIKEGKQLVATQSTVDVFFDERKHKSSIAQQGLGEVEFTNQSGQDTEVDTVKKGLQQDTEQLGEKRRTNFLRLIKGEAKLEPKQLEEIMKNYDKTHEEDELVDEEIKNLKAA